MSGTTPTTTDYRSTLEQSSADWLSSARTTGPASEACALARARCPPATCGRRCAPRLPPTRRPNALRAAKSGRRTWSSPIRPTIHGDNYVLVMTDKQADSPPRLRERLRARGVRFWSVAIAIGSVGILFAGSQIAHNHSQSVEWYTGFGQWLGALGSFIAAGAALWISVTDRRNALADRKRAEAQQDADLQRQAALVTVAAKELARRQAVGASYKAAGVRIRNRRTDRIFDIEVVRYVHTGQDVELQPARINGFDVFPIETDRGFRHSSELAGLALQTDQTLAIYQPGYLPNTPAEYASVRYTDSAGRRWEVDTAGAVTRL